MNKTKVVCSLWPLLGVLHGCAAGDPGGPETSSSGGTIGTSGSGGQTGSGGTTSATGGKTGGTGGTTGGTGGVASSSGGVTGGSGGAVGSGGTGPVGSGGRVGSGGSAASGGAGSGGAAGTTGGRGGAPAGTGGSASGSGGAGMGGMPAAVPSAGCAKMTPRPSGGKVTVTNDHIYDFPTTYDGTKPFPLFMGFHAAGNAIDQIEGLTNNSDLATGYVRAFAKSAGNEWSYNTDLSSKVYKAYDDLIATYCIDTSRVFAAGHSSGAQMIVQILAHADAAKHLGFKAVAPVAASDYGAITVPIPVMYIQGKMDMVRNTDGHETVARFTKANGCGTMTSAYSAVMTCMSGTVAVAPGCVSYQGCTVPTIWCSHNDPQYSSTNHGWPCFATKAMADFFKSLP